MILFSLDQSITKTGYAIWELKKGQINLKQYGTIKLNAREPYLTRIFSLEALFDKMVIEQKITHVIYEQIQLQSNRNVATFKKLSALQFFIEYYCWNRKLQFEPPIHVSTYRTNWAKAAFNLNRGDKLSVFQYIKDKLGNPEGITPDVSDAITMAWYYCFTELRYSNIVLNEATIQDYKV